MKKLILLTIVAAFFAGTSSVKAQINDPQTAFKKHLSQTVENVEKAETPNEKRALLNSSLDDITTAISKVEKMRSISDEDKAGLSELKDSIQEKRDELNGLNGFNRINDGQLNNYANYIMQDFEQASNTVTFSVTTLLLIILILILI